MPRERLLIRNGLVVDVEPSPYVRANTDVLVEDGRIAAVGNAHRATQAVTALGKVQTVAHRSAHAALQLCRNCLDR